MPFEFKVVDGACKQDFEMVEKLFNTTITALYGPQASALNKIAKGEDRLCEIMFDNGNPLGFIVYKKALQNGALELKTLTLFNPDDNSGKGHGTALLERVLETAARRQASKIAVTVSSRSPSLGFFLKKEFTILKTSLGMYREGVVENIMTRSVVMKSQLIATPPVPISVPAVTTTTAAVKPTIFSSVPQDRLVSIQPIPVTQLQAPTECTLKGVYVDAIRSGKKTHEGRVATQFFDGYVPGRIITWAAGPNKVTTKIITREKFKSFEDMIDKVGFKNLVPEAVSRDVAVKLYHSIPGYTDKARRFGVLALGVEKTSVALDASAAASSTITISSDTTQSSRKRSRSRDDNYNSRGRYSSSSYSSSQQYDNSYSNKRVRREDERSNSQDQSRYPRP